MIEIEKPNITTVNLSEDGKSGKFIVDPLERGYGTTLGNSLRRILLSSLPGVAVTSIKIDGVLHEFSTIPGVKEDVTEIVLNVKGITAKLHCNAPKTVVIDVTGEQEVTAGDIKQDSDIEILNPDHHIATVGANERFYMELTFEHGRGLADQLQAAVLVQIPVLALLAVQAEEVVVLAAPQPREELHGAFGVLRGIRHAQHFAAGGVDVAGLFRRQQVVLQHGVGISRLHAAADFVFLAQGAFDPQV